jgi:two-component system phosphate regulon response regulator PhoB
MYPAPRTVILIVADSSQLCAAAPWGSRLRTLRSLVYRFESSPAFAHALHDADQELGLPPGERVDDGEWVLAMFEVGEKRRATASAARGLLRGPGAEPVLVFDRRDWERIVDFAEAGSVRLMPVAAPSGPGHTAAWPPPDGRVAGDLKLRVLVVDDEPEVCEIVRAMLEAIGLHVESVGSAEAALERVRARGCDLVVLDWDLPGMSGLELCRRLRKDPTQAGLPILFLSGQASSQALVDAFASGADDYVTKPFLEPELGARISGLLRRAQRSGPGPR